MRVNIYWKVIEIGGLLTSRTVKEVDDARLEAVLVVKKDSFEVQEAFLLKDETDRKIEEIKGIEAYIEGKKEFKQKLFKAGLNEGSELFIQCISALIQAETYVYEERGFSDKEEYNAYWDELEDDRCRMYSRKRRHMRKNDLPWMDYVPDNFGNPVLFERRKTYSTEEYGDSHICKASLSDTYHEMKFVIKIGEEELVDDFDIEFIRAPGSACFTNKENSGKIIGKRINDLTKKEVIEFLGGCDGCYHIVEMFLEARDVIRGSI